MVYGDDDDNKFSSVITEANKDLWDYYDRATEEIRQEITSLKNKLDRYKAFDDGKKGTEKLKQKVNNLKNKLNRCKDYYAGMAEAMINGDITSESDIDTLISQYNNSDLMFDEVVKELNK